MNFKLNVFLCKVDYFYKFISIIIIAFHNLFKDCPRLSVSNFIFIEINVFFPFLLV